MQPRDLSVEKLHASRMNHQWGFTTLLSADINILPLLRLLPFSLSIISPNPRGRTLMTDFKHDPSRVGQHVQFINLHIKHEVLDI